MNSDPVDFHSYVDKQLASTGFRIIRITEELMKVRIDDFISFVNKIRKEHGKLYGWKEENREYFLNPMKHKFKYSYAIINSKDEICFLNFSSVYDEVMHYHFAYAREDTRGLNLSKLHFLKLCQICLEDGFTRFEAFWPKNNNNSIILYLKMGWQIESLRNDKDLFMVADIENVRNRTYELLLKGK